MVENQKNEIFWQKNENFDFLNTLVIDTEKVQMF